MVRDFQIPQQDQDNLNALGYSWDTKIDGGVKLVVIHNFPIPDAYNVQQADVALLIESCYPDVQIDMAFFNPSLSRRDGKPINSLTPRVMMGTAWQQWSRHRTPQNPWRPGIDDVLTHFELVQYWLEKELIV